MALQQIYDASIDKAVASGAKILFTREQFISGAFKKVDPDQIQDATVAHVNGSLFFYQYPIFLTSKDTFDVTALHSLDLCFGDIKKEISKYKEGNLIDGNVHFLTDWYMDDKLPTVKDQTKIVKLVDVLADFDTKGIVNYKALYNHCFDKLEYYRKNYALDAVQAATRNSMQKVIKDVGVPLADDDDDQDDQQDLLGSSVIKDSLQQELNKPQDLIAVTNGLTMEDYLRSMRSIMGDKFLYILPLLQLDHSEARELYQFNEQYGIVQNILGNIDDAKRSFFKLTKGETFDKSKIEFHPVSSDKIRNLKDETGVDSPAARMQAAAVDNELVMLVGDAPNYGDNKVYLNLYEKEPENDAVYVVAPSRNMAGYGLSTDSTYGRFEAHLKANASTRLPELKPNTLVKVRKFRDFEAMDAVAACNLISYSNCKSKIGFNFNTFGANITNPTSDHCTAILPPLIVYYSRGLPDLYKMAYAYRDANFRDIYDNRFRGYLHQARDYNSQMIVEGREIETDWDLAVEKLLSMYVLEDDAIKLINIKVFKTFANLSAEWDSTYKRLLALKHDYDKIASGDRASFLGLLSQVSIFPNAAFMYRLYYDHYYQGKYTQIYSAADFMRVGRAYPGDQFYRPKVYGNETKNVSVNQDVWAWYDLPEEGNQKCNAVLDFRVPLLIDEIQPGQHNERDGKVVSLEETTKLYVDQLDEKKRSLAWNEVKARIDFYIKSKLELIGVVIPYEKLPDVVQDYKVISILPGPLPCLLSVAVVIAPNSETRAGVGHVARYTNYLFLKVRRMIYMFQYARYGYTQLYRQQLSVHLRPEVQEIYDSWRLKMEQRHASGAIVRTGRKVKLGYSKLLSKEMSAQKAASVYEIGSQSRSLRNSLFSIE